jgi:ferric-dicitrate binding protein FerR (iron transport regulator)
MTKSRKRSARRQQALEAQRQKERRQRLRAGGIAALVIAVLGGLLWLANRPKTVESRVPFAADGTAWGPVGAPVLIEEWSDFN